jgi:NTE family protein
MNVTPPLFAGLDAEALDEVLRRMQPRRFSAHAVICRKGEPGGSLFLIQNGLAEVVLEQPGGTRGVARLRRGEVVGELSLVTGEPRSATVVASVPTDVLEMSQDTFTSLLARFPALLGNLNRILSQRLLDRNLKPADERRRGELIAIVVDRVGESLAAATVATTRAASPKSVAAINLITNLTLRDATAVDSGVAGVLTVVDDLLPAHGTVLVLAGTGQADLPLLLDHMDRTLVVATSAAAATLADRLGDGAIEVELAVVADRQEAEFREPAGFRRIRRVDRERPARDVGWLGRHLSRTKLGLALGAGGAKGYAHVAALHVLEGAGYTVDYVAGSSIGAMVGSWLALGQTAAEIEATMRNAFTPDRVAAMFKLSMSGLSSGLDIHAQVCRDTTENRTFDDLQIPLVAMAVDLDLRQPAPLRQGLLWEALLASTALAGMFPPHRINGRRLVDGLALVPVPTGSVIEDGADVTVSVNIMSRETLPAWPGEDPPPPPSAKAGSRMLDTLLEVMDLAQLDASVRHAALANVVITPRFGPASWRDFHRADQFLAAGRLAAEEKLDSLRALARPQGVSPSAP